MPHPMVVHCKHSHYDVYIGRPGKWGNPYIISKELNREDAITLYKAWLCTQDELLQDISELKGKILGCWCAPLPCHGDILATLANG